MPLPNIIKICLRVSKLWNAQDFGFRGDNYIMKKKVRVVSLACDTPTGPPLHFYQILSYYLKQYESYSLHKILASAYRSSSFLPNIIKICLRVSKLWSAQDFGFRVDNYITNKVRVVSPAQDMPAGPLLHFYQILTYYLSTGVIACTRFRLKGEITT